MTGNAFSVRYEGHAFSRADFDRAANDALGVAAVSDGAVTLSRGGVRVARITRKGKLHPHRTLSFTIDVEDKYVADFRRVLRGRRRRLEQSC